MVDGPNMYGAFLGDPVNNRDPMGTCTECDNPDCKNGEECRLGNGWLKGVGLAFVDSSKELGMETASKLNPVAIYQGVQDIRHLWQRSDEVGFWEAGKKCIVERIPFWRQAKPYREHGSHRGNTSPL